MAKAKSPPEFEVVQQNLPGCLVKLTIKVPAKAVKKCHDRVADNLQKLIGKVPGFPANKPLPMGLIIDRCGGPKKFALAVIEDVLLMTVRQVMERYNSVMYPDSDKMLTDVRDLMEALDPEKPLEFEMQFEMLPSIKWKQPYKDIQLSIQDTGNEETDKVAAEEFIRQELKNKGYQRVVADRGLQAGDLAVIDMDIRSPGSKQPMPGMSKEMLAFDTEVDPLGLTQHLEGVTANEVRKFDITFPDDWHDEQLRGDTAIATIKVHELFQWVLPEFDEAFVKKHYPAYSGPEEMRQAIIRSTQLQRFQQRDQDIQEAFLARLVEIVDVTVPDNMVQDVGTNEYQSSLLLDISKGTLKPQEAEALMTEERVNGYIEANRAKLQDIAKAQLASSEIVQAEGLQVTPEQLEAEVQDAVRQFQAQRMEYDEERIREQAEETLKAVALMNWVKANLKIDIQPFVAPA